jgi:hypothetical protein
METTPYELTPEQKGMLATLSRETGKPIPALLAEALGALQEREHMGHPYGTTDAPAPAPVASPPPAEQPIWEIADELFGAIPDEELARLPIDGAAEHDHYLYGWPKRSP